jgi:hypothetical protein
MTKCFICGKRLWFETFWERGFYWDYDFVYEGNKEWMYDGAKHKELLGKERCWHIGCIKKKGTVSTAK